ncbi:hypothetical protein ANN_11795 [Periplaneta americana]|uniref:Uncharacterized protein n=1 Tax=Periplaneta americana TaxID=6978 RepID=A0ABQ8T7V6_PERAM|nr:hypothetical protein ANN_11795 [Periplaneta americana]
MASLCEGGNEPAGSLKAIYLRHQLLLPSTAQYENLLQELRTKRSQIWSDFYTTEAMLSDEWKRPYYELRHTITRFAVHGFHFKICKTTGYHEPSAECVANSCLGRALVKEDEYEEVRRDGTVRIILWRERVFRLRWEERWKSVIVLFSPHGVCKPSIENHYLISNLPKNIVLTYRLLKFEVVSLVGTA